MRPINMDERVALCMLAEETGGGDLHCFINELNYLAQEHDMTQGLLLEIILRSPNIPRWENN